jgi:hypothetical protein
MKEETRQEISAAYAKDYTDWMVKTGGYAKDMTLRDHFAGQVAIGLMSEYWNSDSMTDPSFQNIARQAYWLADAMLEERNK